MHPLPLKSIKEANTARRESREGQSCGRKKKFDSMAEAKKCQPGQNAYHCDYCGKFHLSSVTGEVNALMVKISKLEKEVKEQKKKYAQIYKDAMAKFEKDRAKEPNAIIVSYADVQNKLAKKIETRTRDSLKKDYEAIDQKQKDTITTLIIKIRKKNEAYFDIYNRVLLHGLKFHYPIVEVVPDNGCEHEWHFKEEINEPIANIKIGVIFICTKCKHRNFNKETRCLGDGNKPMEKFFCAPEGPR